ncbi:MAG: SGNH/GDSL hydrolase family protein [Phycisphaerales bacterium]|nr:SGNH/GDSL hydrolase family protein [Phycisphaerales bacterium]
MERSGVSIKGSDLRFVALIAWLPLLPFVDHRSDHPWFLGYSLAYLLFLLATPMLALAWSALSLKCAGRTGRRGALWLTACLCGAVLLAETVLGMQDAFAEYRRWGHMRSPLMGFEAQPDHHWQIGDVRFSTDADGFRAHPTPRPAPSAERRVFVMGESATFGYGIPDDQTWAQLLEARLRADADPNVSVINAGCTGHMTLQQLIRLHVRVLPQRPEWVVYYGAINDVYGERRGGALVLMPKHLVDASSMREYLRLRNDGGGFYMENSLLLDVLAGGARRILRGTVPDSRDAAPNLPTATRRAQARFIDNLESMRLLCERAGARFVTATFLADPSNLEQPLADGIRDLNEQLREAARSGRLDVIDLEPALSAVEEPSRLFYPDHYHPSAAGCTFIAQQLAGNLAGRLQGSVAAKGG